MTPQATAPNIIGHAERIADLNRMLATGAIAPAYLFAGPAHVGKTTVARAFAAALARGGAALAEPAAHPDVTLVAPPTPRTTHGMTRAPRLKVEDARMIGATAARTPLSGVRRVVIVAQADTMTEAAQNALLKTLEEPPHHTVLILTAAREGHLLPTVRSRLQRVRFAPVADALLAEVAAAHFATERERTTALAVANGCPGVLLALARDADAFARARTAAAQAEAVCTMSVAQKVALAQELARDAATAHATLVLWMALWRRALPTAPPQRRAALARHLRAALETCAVLERTQVNARLALEDFLFTLA